MGVFQLWHSRKGSVPRGSGFSEPGLLGCGTSRAQENLHVVEVWGSQG